MRFYRDYSDVYCLVLSSDIYYAWILNRGPWQRGYWNPWSMKKVHYYKKNPMRSVTQLEILLILGPKAIEGASKLEKAITSRASWLLQSRRG